MKFVKKKKYSYWVLLVELFCVLHQGRLLAAVFLYYKLCYFQSCGSSNLMHRFTNGPYHMHRGCIQTAAITDMNCKKKFTRSSFSDGSRAARRGRIGSTYTLICSLIYFSYQLYAARTMLQIDLRVNEACFLSLFIQIFLFKLLILFLFWFWVIVLTCLHTRETLPPRGKFSGVSMAVWVCLGCSVSHKMPYYVMTTLFPEN